MEKASPVEKLSRRMRLHLLRRLWDEWIEQVKLHEHIFLITVAIIIGSLCGISAVAFRYLIDFFHHLFWGVDELKIAVLQDCPWYLIVLLPAAGGLIMGPIVHFFAREAKGHGVPEVMAAVAVRNGVIRIRVALAKALASAITIASGGSAGREGPIIQIGSAIGSAVGQFFNVSRRRLRTFVGCGAAAGIAATFNAPIAGALFAVEVILADFGVAQFSPIVISSVLATVIARHYFGDGPVFNVPDYELVSGTELIPYLLLGIMCGLVSVVFIRVLYFSEDVSDRIKKVPEYLKPMLGGFLLGLLGLMVPHIYGDGYETIDLAMLNDLAWPLLLVFLVAKILGTSFTLGSGGSGGVFAPSLFIGAMTGGLLGQATSALMGDMSGSAGGYALVAMGGVVAGTTHAPITAILIIFEITNNYHIILPLMTVCIISTLLSSRISGESIYTLKLVRKGINIFHGRSLDPLKTFQVNRCIRSDAETISPLTPVHELLNHMIETDKSHVYVVDAEEHFVGVITLSNMRRLLMHHDGLEHVLLAEDFTDEGIPFCTPEENLSQAFIKFEQAGLPELPVISDAADRKLAGIIRYTDVLGIYNREIMRQDTADGLASRLTSSPSRERVALSGNVSIIEWDPPASFIGQPLSSLNLPGRYRVRVLLIKKKSVQTGKDELEPEMPGGETVLTAQDILVLSGKNADLDRIQKL